MGIISDIHGVASSDISPASSNFNLHHVAILDGLMMIIAVRAPVDTGDEPIVWV